METSSKIGLLRLSQIIGDKNANHPIPAIIPVSRSTWWAGVKIGRFPKPVKIGQGRATFWLAHEIYALVSGGEK